MALITENLICMLELLVAYAAFCVLWPMFLLRPVIKDRSPEFQIVFAQVFMNLYITVIGYLLAFTGQFNRSWLIALLIVLPFLLWIWYCHKQIKKSWDRTKQFIQEYRVGLYGRHMRGRIFWEKTKSIFRRLYTFWLKGRIIQIITVSALMAFVVYYFGYFKLHHYAYAYTDEETHLYWIQSLISGNAFPAGLYPHAMHFLVATLAVMFSFETPLLWHMFSILSSMLIFLMLYFCIRTLLPSRATGMVGLGLFILSTVFRTDTYIRYQYSLPMEFGFSAAFAMVIGFVYYVRDRSRLSLALFMMAIIWSFQAHFYATIAAAFLGIGLFVVFLPLAIKERILRKILIGAIVAQLVAFVPFGVGYAAGYTFERSIAWGLDILKGGDGSSTLPSSSESEDTENVEASDLGTETSETLLTDPELTEEEIAAYRGVFEKDFFSLTNEEIGLYYDGLREYYVEGVTGKQYILQNIHDSVSLRNAICFLLAYYVAINGKAVLVLYGLELFAVLYGLLCLIWCHKKKKDPDTAKMILLIGFMWASVFLLHVMPILGLPALLAVNRSAEVLALVTAMLFAVPVQALADLLGVLPVQRKHTERLLALGVAIFLGMFYAGGKAKSISSLYYNFAIQDLDMELCQNLLSSGEDFQWTVVSAVNDLSVLRLNGYHYEIVDLLDNMEAGYDIYIPTPDIYLVVENEIPSFGTNRSDIRMVDNSDFLDYAIEVDPSYVTMTMEELGENTWVTRDRAYYDSRFGVMSKFYYWMEKIKEVYPAEVSVYLTDDYCTVYHIHQDPYFLLNLNVDYQSDFRSELVQK